LIKFVWSRLIHAPLPSKLIYVDCYWKHCGSCINLSLSEPVKFLVSFSFKTESFSPNFYYKGRNIATPFLFTSGLADPVGDSRILGNCVYLSNFSRLSAHVFTDFFAGADTLGVYDLNVASLSKFKKAQILPRLSEHVVINYYVVDIPGEKRISEFFNKYEHAESFSREIFMTPGEEVKNFFTTPIVGSSIRSCIRRLKHPIGIFSHVRTMVGSINASELLFEFRKYLICGGGN